MEQISQSITTPKETKQLGIFEENEDSIKIIEWPKLLENIIQKKDRLEINFKYTESARSELIYEKLKLKHLELKDKFDIIFVVKSLSSMRIPLTYTSI